LLVGLTVLAPLGCLGLWSLVVYLPIVALVIMTRRKLKAKRD
jgi:hypothetical protein